MRRHGTNFTALAAILGGAVMGAGATMALANATDEYADLHRHGTERGHTIVVCENGAPFSSSMTISRTTGETSIAVAEYRPPQDRRPVRKRRRCRRIVTTDVGHQAQLHSRLQEVQARAQEVQVRVQAAQVRAEEAQVRARQAQVRAQKLREAMTELREDAGSTIDTADLERLRAIIAEVREQRRAHDQSSGK